MTNRQRSDPYVYPNSTVLINKFDIHDQDELSRREGAIFVIQNSKPLPAGHFDYDHLKAIHHHFFHLIYEWAGKERTVDIAKGESYFANSHYISNELHKLFNKLKQEQYLLHLTKPAFCEKLSFYFNELNAIHPFREGNGRTQRAFYTELAKQAKYDLDWEKTTVHKYIQASIEGFSGHYSPMTSIFNKIIVPHSKDIELPTMKKVLPYKNLRGMAINNSDNAIEQLLNSDNVTFNQLLGSLIQRAGQTSDAKEAEKIAYLANKLVESIINNPIQNKLLENTAPTLSEHAKAQFLKNDLIRKKP